MEVFEGGHVQALAHRSYRGRVGGDVGDRRMPDTSCGNRGAPGQLRCVSSCCIRKEAPLGGTHNIADASDAADIGRKRTKNMRIQF
ncbi:hypothetical protein E2C01_057513 [Portunus trituberculatus]|uniref:Uncharacterized protein n=1 Tax=Portunus trituberculatus TaxID=210409 RepID=A0A5B7H198_PORTR|nr:hypothetical protein [Portunus trituberculatus]